jgi:hypothetical protein
MLSYDELKGISSDRSSSSSRVTISRHHPYLYHSEHRHDPRELGMNLPLKRLLSIYLGIFGVFIYSKLRFMPMDSGKILALAVLASLVAIAAASVAEVSAQDNMTGGNMTEGNYTDMNGNMTDVSASDAGSISGLLGGF